jgi:hypothetical protein
MGGLLLSPTMARAQSDAAIAEQLFRDGRALMDAGKTDEACDKFASSQRLSPAMGTQLNLAICREKQGKTATAWSLFADVEAAAQRQGDTARARIAHEHATQLGGQLKKVVIEVPSPPAGMVVSLDGTALPTGALGTEIPLDPGSHHLKVSAPGKKTWEQANLSLGPSATTIHVRVELEDEGATSPPPPPPPPKTSPAPPTSPSTESSPPPPSPSPTDSSSPTPEQGPTTEHVFPADPSLKTRRIVGIAAGGAGVVLLGIAAYYGLTAISRKNDESNYPEGSQARWDVWDQSRQAQTWGFVFAGFGAAAIGTGAYLFLTARDAPPQSAAALRVTPSAGPGFGGLSLNGHF